jgi:hypothetical protein
MRGSAVNTVNRACIWLLAVLLCISNPVAVSPASPAYSAGRSSSPAYSAGRSSGHEASPVDPHLGEVIAPLGLSEGPFNVSDSASDSRAPAMAVGINLVHVVWEEGSRIYDRMFRGGVWASSRSVATGEQPAIAVDALGVAHVVFVNEFDENYEVYYCRWNGTSWSLPRNVSNTSGVSSAPGIAIEPSGVLHVVWADNTPGYSVIYHAYWNGTYWLNEPIPHAMGGAPAIAVSPSGLVDVVWQDRDAADLPYEIYHSQWNGQEWSLPENLSDSASEQSIIPSVAMDQNDQAHVTWQEKLASRYVIYYTYGQVSYWSIPEQVSANGADAYLPSTAVRPPPPGGLLTAGGSLYVGWDESTLAIYRSKSAAGGEWSPPSTVLTEPLGVADLQLAMDAAGVFHAVWSQRISANNWEVFYQCLSKTLFLPVILKRLSR